jgi:hypothetical protein
MDINDLTALLWRHTDYPDWFGYAWERTLKRQLEAYKAKMEVSELFDFSPPTEAQAQHATIVAMQARIDELESELHLCHLAGADLPECEQCGGDGTIEGVGNVCTQCNGFGVIDPRLSELEAENAQHMEAIQDLMYGGEADQELIQVMKIDKDALERRVNNFEAENQHLRRMLYDMVSLTDWMKAGYSIDEYNTCMKLFKNEVQE